jgi:putative oxidoreductase
MSVRAIDFHRPKLAHDILRYTLAVEFLSHTITRMATDRVTAFGAFLGGAGFPAGIAWAWGVTLWELVGGVLLVLGWKTPWVAMVFVVQMVFAFFLVHLRFGWFVVGHGSNGVEYAVCIAAMCLAVAFTAPRKDSP